MRSYYARQRLDGSFRRRRLALGKKLGALASALGVSVPAVSQWERGGRRPVNGGFAIGTRFTARRAKWIREAF